MKHPAPSARGKKRRTYQEGGGSDNLPPSERKLEPCERRGGYYARFMDLSLLAASVSPENEQYPQKEGGTFLYFYPKKKGGVSDGGKPFLPRKRGRPDLAESPSSPSGSDLTSPDREEGKKQRVEEKREM